MNDKAIQIGMKNTVFVNNHGLEENDGSGNMSTAYDMALLMKYAMNNKIFRNITSTKQYKLKTNYKSYEWINKNKLLSEYQYTTGGKTGYTKKAKRTLVTAASKDNKELIIVTLNDPNDFKNHINLYNKYFELYKSVLIIDKNNLRNVDNKWKNTNLYVKNNYYILLKNDNSEKIDIEYELFDKRKVNNNDYVGNINVYINGDLVHKENIFIAKNVIKKDGLFSRIRRWFSD